MEIAESFVWKNEPPPKNVFQVQLAVLRRTWQIQPFRAVLRDESEGFSHQILKGLLKNLLSRQQFHFATINLMAALNNFFLPFC